MNDSGAESFGGRWGLDRASFLARHATPTQHEVPDAGPDAQPGGRSAPGTAADAPDQSADESAHDEMPASDAYDYLFRQEGEETRRENKVPRGLHLWFALALGVLALLLALGQGLLGRVNRPDRIADPVPVRGAEAAPALAGLQREIARQRGSPPKAADVFGEQAGMQPVKRRGTLRQDGSASPLFGLAEARESTRSAAGQLPAGSHVHLPASGSASSDPAATETDLPEALLEPELDDTRRYEQDKARNVIAGSHILAINHPPSVAGADPMALDPLPIDDALPAKMIQWLHASPRLLRGALDAVKQLAPGQGSLNPAGANPLTAADAQDPAPAVDASEQTGTPVVLDPAGASGGSARGRRGEEAVTTFPPRSRTPALYPRPAAASLLLLEGTPIPCVLLTEVRSDLPGMIVAQVSEDVFDSVRAEVRLLPRGTRMIGRYDTQVAGGQQRLLASFHRLILPDASSIDLGRMDAADISGSAGLQDEVDTHFWGRFGQAFLTAGLARAAQNPRGAVTVNGVGGVLPGPDATGQILVDTARTSLQAGVQLAPTLIIRRGFPFQVMVNRDLVLEAWR